MKKIREWMHNKYMKAGVVAGALGAMMAVSASAAEVDSSAAITGAFSTGFQQMASDALGMIAVIVPIALGVAGTVFLVKKAMGWFKSLAK